MTQCKLCRAEIIFSDWHISPSGKKIPLDAMTEEPHKCSVWAAQHRKYYPCRNNCGGKIYFDEKQKSNTGKWVPIDSETASPHQCPELEYNI